MAPLIVLVVVTVVCRGMGELGWTYAGSWPAATAIGLSAMLVVTGIAHFAPGRRAGLVAIVPPPFSHPGTIVTVTGIVELVAAAVLLVSPELGPWRVIAAWMVALLLVAMFPANVYAAAEKRHDLAPDTPLARRTVMQCVFIAAAVLVATAS